MKVPNKVQKSFIKDEKPKKDISLKEISEIVKDGFKRKDEVEVSERKDKENK